MSDEKNYESIVSSHDLRATNTNHEELFSLLLSWINNSKAIKLIPMVMAESAILKAGQW